MSKTKSWFLLSFLALVAAVARFGFSEVIGAIAALYSVFVFYCALKAGGDGNAWHGLVLVGKVSLFLIVVFCAFW